MLNTHPQVYWFALPKPIVCPPFFMAPACLLSFHRHSLHLYCSASPSHGTMKRPRMSLHSLKTFNRTRAHELFRPALGAISFHVLRGGNYMICYGVMFQWLHSFWQSCKELNHFYMHISLLKY